MDGKRAWRASEALAARHLESQGFKVVDMHRKITVGQSKLFPFLEQLVSAGAMTLTQQHER